MISAKFRKKNFRTMPLRAIALMIRNTPPIWPESPDLLSQAFPNLASLHTLSTAKACVSDALTLLFSLC